ncbi:hypothetical protein ACTXT7_016406 [Hymenolepis weldensis]
MGTFDRNFMQNVDSTSQEEYLFELVRQMMTRLQDEPLSELVYTDRKFLTYYYKTVMDQRLLKLRDTTSEADRGETESFENEIISTSENYLPLKFTNFE